MSKYKCKAPMSELNQLKLDKLILKSQISFIAYKAMIDEVDRYFLEKVDCKFWEDALPLCLMTAKECVKHFSGWRGMLVYYISNKARFVSKAESFHLQILGYKLWNQKVIDEWISHSSRLNTAPRPCNRLARSY
jgi:hypothetical protein